MKFPIFANMEQKSIYGIPHENSKLRFWAEVDQTGKRTGNAGNLRASTEIEALDRLREAYPEIGRIEWIRPEEYEQSAYPPQPA